jgi:hypothetical protein
VGLPTAAEREVACTTNIASIADKPPPATTPHRSARLASLLTIQASDIPDR